MNCVVGRAQVLLHQGLLLLLQRLDSFLKEDQSMFTINYLIWREGGREGGRDRDRDRDRENGDLLFVNYIEWRASSRRYKFTLRHCMFVFLFAPVAK